MNFKEPLQSFEPINLWKLMLYLLNRFLNKFGFLNRIKMMNCIKYLKQSVSPNNLWMNLSKDEVIIFYMNLEQLVSNSEIWANKILFGPAGLTGEILIQFYAWFMGQHSKFISTSVSEFYDWMCFWQSEYLKGPSKLTNKIFCKSSCIA